MILIETVDDKYFTLDGIRFAKIYQPLAQGSQAIGIYSIYDTRQQLVNSTKFDEFQIDGEVCATQTQTIEAILGVVLTQLSNSDIELLEGRVDVLESDVDDLESEDALNKARITTNENNIATLQNSLNGFLPQGEIDIAADFPTTGEVQPGHLYVIKSNVTDNDPAKTNTGLSFLAGVSIVWSVEGTWIDLGSNYVTNDQKAKIDNAANYHGVILVSNPAIVSPFEGMTVIPLEDGTYSNFNNLVRSNEICIFVYESSVWTKKQIEDLGVLLQPYSKALHLVENESDSYVFPIVDSNDRLLGGFKKDGSFLISKYLEGSINGNALKDGDLTLIKLDSDLQARIYSDLSNETGFSYVVIDSNERILFGIKTDGSFVASKFNSSNLQDESIGVEKLETGLQTQINDSEINYLIPCFGDSLTAGAGGGGTTYPNALEALLPERFTVINAGVGGENVPTIAARQGGITAIIDTAFTLPADTSEVEISSDADIRLINSLDGANIKVLLQGEGNSVNPCFVQGVECTLLYNSTGGIYTLKRNVADTVVKDIVANSTLTFSGSTKYRNTFALIVWVGQNGGYSDDLDLINQIKRMIEFNGSDNYLVLGLSTGTLASRSALEKAMIDEFSQRFINTREYLTSYGLIDADITPTAQDLIDMSVGSTPESLRSDSVHLNATGYSLLGALLYERFLQLGYINE